MSLSIHTNYAALVTQNSLNRFNAALSTTQQRLGTGLRINSAADDAAGLQIATRLNANIRGMTVAIRNTSDGISLLQTAEGAFKEMTDIVLRMKDLATQAASDTNGDADRTALQAEVDQLTEELNNILDNTKYAGEALFNGGKFENQVSLQIGASSAETLDIDVSGTLTNLISTIGNFSSADLSDADGARTAMDDFESALDDIGALRAEFGAYINRLTHTSNNLRNMTDNTEMAKGRIMDADFALESANLSKNSMLLQSGISMLRQASQMPSLIMGLLG
ncbi:MAG: Lateral flagellin [Xanthomonadaceae bacterium]|nr:Lateral flagellin [Xanthomonadaceae bacterium]